ncbi:MAG: hypothetical protein Q9M91_02630 [Candidatus Dojkabacteria bacterium]|nr:hypothetical protein [Candidatus Dojkabacteria bacterium]MDQ7020720.1 hypothetical protein [Candidatus Dojkabacteria bacterium]
MADKDNRDMLDDIYKDVEQSPADLLSAKANEYMDRLAIEGIEDIDEQKFYVAYGIINQDKGIRAFNLLFPEDKIFTTAPNHDIKTLPNKLAEKGIILDDLTQLTDDAMENIQYFASMCQGSTSEEYINQ